MVGQQVEATMVASPSHLVFELTANATGTLEAQLEYDSSETFLSVTMGNSTGFSFDGVLHVTAGETYLLVVEADSWYFPFPDVPFVLTTSIEPDPPCPTIQPVFDWVCVNSGWVPPNHPLALGQILGPALPAPAPITPISPALCVTGAPGPTFVCVNGGWVPMDHPLAISTPTSPTPPSLPTPTGPCITPDPFIGTGLVGVCIGGGWVPVGHPLAGGGG
jgi:hypothetical protein